MRRFISVFGALAMLAATATSTFADVQTVVEGGQKISIAEIGRTYSGIIDARNDDTYVSPNGVPYQPWKFQARAGQCVEITMRSQTIDSFIQVYDGNITIANDDDNGGGLDAHSWVTLNHDGWYYLATAVSPNNSDGSKRGYYTLSLSPCMGASSWPPTQSTGPASSSSSTLPGTPARSTGPAGSTPSTGSTGTAPSTGANGVPLPRY